MTNLANSRERVFKWSVPAVTRRQHGRQACPRHVGQVCGLEVIDADPEMTSDERAGVEFEVAGSSRPNLRYRCGVGVSLQLKVESETERVARGRERWIGRVVGLSSRPGWLLRPSDLVAVAERVACSWPGEEVAWPSELLVAK